MKHLQLTLGYLREQRAKIDSSISLLETLLGGNGNGNGNGIMRIAESALALHTDHAARTKTGTPRQRKPQQMKPLPQIPIPAGLDVKGKNLREAIPVALKAYKKPADSKHLAALLLGAGFEWHNAMPLTTAAAMVCGRYPKELGIKGNAETGWSLRG